MIAVTGLRSGTSLMMQTLKIIGVPVEGLLFHDDFPIKELKPKGYYELPYKMFLTDTDWSKYGGKAVKLAGYTLLNMKPGTIEKVIWCRRNPEEAIESVLKLISIDSKYSNVNNTIENARFLYNINNDYIYQYISKNDTPMLMIYYEEMLLCPEETIKKIADFIDIDSDILSRALENIEGRVLCQ